MPTDDELLALLVPRASEEACALDDIPLAVHPACELCGELIGEWHIYEVLLDGRCPKCQAHQERMDVLGQPVRPPSRRFSVSAPSYPRQARPCP